MTPSDLSAADIDDVGAALREDRPLRPAAGYRVLFAEASLDFSPLVLDDPVPLGRQILASAGRRALEAYSLFALVTNGDFEDVRLDEPFDLRAKGAERFIAFASDRTFRFLLEARQISWGLQTISESILRQLADAADDEAIFLEIRGGADRPLEPGEEVDLGAPGVERFIIAPRPKPHAFKVGVIYNGVEKTFEVRRDEPTIRLLDRAKQAFGPIPNNAHLLSLFKKNGVELQDSQTIDQAGVEPGEVVLMRPSQVRGG